MWIWISQNWGCLVGAPSKKGHIILGCTLGSASAFMETTISTARLLGRAAFLFANVNRGIELFGFWGSRLLSSSPGSETPCSLTELLVSQMELIRTRLHAWRSILKLLNPSSKSKQESGLQLLELHSLPRAS